MRPRLRTAAAVAHALGLVLLLLAAAMLVTGFVGWLLGEPAALLARAFGAPALATATVGALTWWRTEAVRLDEVQAMLVCGLAWILASVIGAVPLCVLLDSTLLDASFEMVSGFTTTGITLLEGLDAMPASVLLWRALSQWIGGVGILSLFVAVTRSPALAHRFGGTEAHKIRASRPVPGPFRTLQLFALVYLGLTILVALGLLLGGVGWFDAITHALTTMSTGGFSTHDASVGYWRDPDLSGVSPRWIEWVVIAGMAAGGTSFVIHYRLARGEVRALWDGVEIRVWFGLLIAVLGLLVFEQWQRGTGMFAADGLVTTHAAGPGWAARIEAGVRTSLFTTLAIATTTGFATVDIAGPFFASTAKALFLLLMIFGACVGSTSGGFKLARVVLLAKIMTRELRRLTLPQGATTPVVIEHHAVDQAELARVVGLAIAWLGLLALGTLLTTLLSAHDGWQAFSGVSSALNNIGPCYITIPEMRALDPAVKLTWMVAMLAGRLEILPLVVLLSPRAWTR
ncbi:Trk system potassium uptake protein TrkG [Enhygromyxa salina]|uniref:Trk system potassium uptake protein TrkG n=1 Tax=Enhygromyxa salina TaxID=215803 RepID=A0A2S9XSZ5_9BACT|nr:potassium transporter TrkG [Enhygromyxa salina]PRP95860.1 Trk system potassium uptake protein TrkG [Enhygromyxa salina]